MVWLPNGEKFDDTFSRLAILTEPACDRQTSYHGIVRAMHTCRAVKTDSNMSLNFLK